jgi:hypothetical protein
VVSTVVGLFGLKLKVEGATAYKCPILECLLTSFSKLFPSSHVMNDHSSEDSFLIHSIGQFWGSLIIYRVSHGSLASASLSTGRRI